MISYFISCTEFDGFHGCDEREEKMLIFFQEVMPNLSNCRNKEMRPTVKWL